MDDTEEADDAVCPVCEGSTYVGETISCEICTRWFHFTCVGVDHGDACVQSEDVPYYCPSCDVNVRRANKAKKQAQAKEMKAKAQLAESRKVESLPKTVTKQVTEEERIAEYDNSASDEDQLVIDTAARNRHKTSKRKHPPPSSESQSPEKRSSSVITQTLPQLEVTQLNPAKSKSEEEAWLDAVESGDLEQVESCDSELRSLREPSFRTARQRALAGNEEDELEMLEFGRRTAEKEVTEEERAIKAAKRRELETEKREKMKQKTMDTLLKKKESKATKMMKTAKSGSRDDVPRITYVNNGHGISLSYPDGANYPLLKSEPVCPPKPKRCSMCENLKKYNSAKTGSALCSSLACYKADLARIENIVQV